MKIGLLTIHDALNYGAVLQAYASQEVLSRYGDVEIIDYHNRHIERVYSLFNVPFDSRLPKSLLRDLYLFKNKLVRAKKFKSFRDRYLRLSERNESDGALPDLYELFVCGSDQIWNPKITNGTTTLNEDYFFGALPKEVRKISYASSLGSHRYTPAQEGRVKELLSSFEVLSVREKDGVDYLSGFLGRDVYQVLDPTLMLTKEEWKERMGLKEQTAEEDYILVYTVPRSSLLKGAIEYYSNKGAKVVSVDPSLRSAGKVDKQIRCAGPEELLTLILNAKAVVTDSFHGVCFSINFKKEFVALSSGALSNRMRNLLEIAGLESRYVELCDDLKKMPSISDGDYRSAEASLSEARARSWGVLDGHIK